MAPRGSRRAGHTHRHAPARGLTAQLSISVVGSRQRATPVQFLGLDGKPIRSGGFYRCAIECESEVATDEVIYRSRLKDVEVWPVGWPDA
jgi:hypothetical protein